MEEIYNAVETASKFWYTEWYRQDVAPHLTKEQKETVIHRISDLTLEAPIWLDRKTNFIEQFPELKPYSNKPNISGLQLVAVMEAIFAELYPNIHV